jgi:hypothetical protein
LRPRAISSSVATVTSLGDDSSTRCTPIGKSRNEKLPSAAVSVDRARSFTVTFTPAIGRLVKRSTTTPSKFTCGPVLTSSSLIVKW